MYNGNNKCHSALEALYGQQEWLSTGIGWQACNLRLVENFNKKVKKCLSRITHGSGLWSEEMAWIASMWWFFSLLSMNFLTEIIDYHFFEDFGFMLDVTMFTMSPATPIT